MSQEAEKISNYESEAVQKNKAVMKSKFAERYQRMQDRKNDRGAAPNFNTFVTNAVDKTSVAKKTSFSVVTMSGTAEIKSGEESLYTINSYEGEPTDEQKLKVKWCVFIEGKWIPITNTEEREDTNSDPLLSKTRYKEAILYCKIEADKATIKFSKWLDEKNVKVEAYRYKYGDKQCQQITKITAKPEVLSINWVNAKEQKIGYAGYDQDVFLEVESLGLKGKELRLDIFDYDKGGEDDKLDWGANSVKITGRKTLKQFPIKKKTDYGLQQEDENKPGLDLYVVVNSSEPLENCKDKYATYLDLNPDEKVITAYFAEERKKEVQKGKEPPKPEPKKETPKEPIEYMVVKGDNLAKIAEKTGVPYTQIMEVNPDTVWTKLIPKKTKLTIPPKKEESTAKEKEKDTKTITYYQKIDSASLGSEVHLIAETQNLEGKTVIFKVFEKEPILISDKEKPLALLVGEEEKTEVEAKVSDGRAQVAVILNRKDKDAQQRWKDTLSPPDECIDGVWYDGKKDQDVKMEDDDKRIIEEPNRYTPAIKYKEKKKTYLWLQITCEGDQLDFDKKFFTKNSLEVDYSDRAPWMKIAYNELGVEEIEGDKHNEKILDYHNSSNSKGEPDEIAWCGAYVNWVMKQAGYTNLPDAPSKAVRWRKFGKEVSKDKPPYGSIASIAWTKNTDWGAGHVGFVVAVKGEKYYLLGGNQQGGDKKTKGKVCVSVYKKSDILSVNIPLNYIVNNNDFEYDEINKNKSGKYETLQSTR